jgi:hypothetical protein
VNLDPIDLRLKCPGKRYTLDSDDQFVEILPMRRADLQPKQTFSATKPSSKVTISGAVRLHVPFLKTAGAPAPVSTTT